MTTAHTIAIVTGPHLNEAALCDVAECIERDNVPGSDRIARNTSQKCLQVEIKQNDNLS